jgi:hypothetical protein
MLMLSIVGLIILATILMAVDWYVWGPRYRASGADYQAPRRVNEGNYRIQLRSAA